MKQRILAGDRFDNGAAPAPVFVIDAGIHDIATAQNKDIAVTQGDSQLMILVCRENFAYFGNRARGAHGPNENKMSDGGRGRASLGV